MKKYKDITQAHIDGVITREFFNYDKETLIGLLMFELNLFYDDARDRVNQSYEELRKTNKNNPLLDVATRMKLLQ